MDGMHLECAYDSWQSAMKSLGRKKRNWAALCHVQHAFNLSRCHSSQSAMKSLGKKIGQLSDMDGIHLDCECRSWQCDMQSLGREKKNWAALCHGWHAFRLPMPLLAEYHEEFGKEKEKLGSTLPWTACI